MSRLFPYSTLFRLSVDAGSAGFFKCFVEAFAGTSFLHTGQVRKFGNPGVPLAVAVVDGRKLDARVIGVPSGERFHDRPDADVRLGVLCQWHRATRAELHRLALGAGEGAARQRLDRVAVAVGDGSEERGEGNEGVRTV